MEVASKARQRASSSESSEEGPQVLEVDQTLILFDIEHHGNASQIVSIRPLPGVRMAAFRFQTNAPTRYLVCPHSGIIENEQTVKVVIELNENRYNPRHRLQLQAMALKSIPTGKESIWADIGSCEKDLQFVNFELGTMMMKIDSTLHFEDSVSPAEESLTKLTELGSAIGAARVKQLQELEAMLKSDNEVLDKNIKETEKLKNVLLKQISEKNFIAGDTAKNLFYHEQKLQKLQLTVHQDESEIGMLRARNPSQQLPPNCVIT